MFYKWGCGCVGFVVEKKAYRLVDCRGMGDLELSGAPGLLDGDREREKLAPEETQIMIKRMSKLIAQGHLFNTLIGTIKIGVEQR